MTMRLAVTMIPVPIDALSIHIKAVSHHGLSIHHLTEGQHMPPTDETPEIIGPAWVADVVFDLEVGGPELVPRDPKPNPPASSVPVPHGTHGPE